jgi:hypothetical protein
MGAASAGDDPNRTQRSSFTTLAWSVPLLATRYALRGDRRAGNSGDFHQRDYGKDKLIA